MFFKLGALNLIYTHLISSIGCVQNSNISFIVLTTAVIVIHHNKTFMLLNREPKTVKKKHNKHQGKTLQMCSLGLFEQIY